MNRLESPGYSRGEDVNRRPHLAAGVVLAGIGPIAASLLTGQRVPSDDVHAVRLASDDALIVGASGLPTPSQGYVDAAVSEYLQPLGFTGTVATAQAVTTPESFWPLTGVLNLTTDESIARGGQILATDIENHIAAGTASATNPLWIFGYSQGADVETTAMQLVHRDDPTVDPNALHFVLLGDPANPDGGLLSRFAVDIDGSYPTVPGLGITFSGATPDLYPTDIYTMQYDGFADQPRYPIDFLSDLNAILGMGFNHGDYLAPGEMARAALLPGSDGLTNYWFIPSNTLPLLDPLQFIPVIGKPLYDLLEPDMSVLVNLGYGCIDTACRESLTDQAATFASFGPLPQLNDNETWGDVLTALGTGLRTGIDTAINDLHDPSYGPSIMDVPALHSLLESAYHMVGATGPIGTGDDLWNDIVNTLGSGGSGFEILQHAFPGMIPDPPTSLIGILNDVATNVENDFATLIPIANTMTSLLTTIPGIATSFITEEAQGGDLLGGLGDAFAALLGLGPIGLGVGTVVPVVEALAINALNFVELFDPNALQGLAGLLLDIP